MIIDKHLFIEDFELRKIHSVDMSTDEETYFHVNINLMNIDDEIDTAVTYEHDTLESAMKNGKSLAKKYNVPYKEYHGS